MSKAVAERADTNVAAHPASDTTSLLQVITRAASDPNVDIDKMERLMAMHERMVERDAKRAFTEAMTAAQKAMPAIVRDAENKQTNSRYAKLETISDAIDPVIREHGFTISYGTFVSTIPGHYGVEAKVSHSAGHSERYQADVPADTVGPKGNQNKTPTHGFGSTMSYGRRYLKVMIFDVRMKGEDKDGNQSGDVLTEEQVEEIKALIDKAVASKPGTDYAAWLTSFLEYMKVEALNDIAAKDFGKAKSAIENAIRQGAK